MWGDVGRCERGRGKGLDMVWMQGRLPCEEEVALKPCCCCLRSAPACDLPLSPHCTPTPVSPPDPRSSVLTTSHPNAYLNPPSSFQA